MNEACYRLYAFNVALFLHVVNRRDVWVHFLLIMAAAIYEMMEKSVMTRHIFGQVYTLKLYSGV